ncbi:MULTISPECIES: LysR family transcriptional regulator substrate-binding protein [Bacillaceae]|uniref:LysR substrate-binding domain-containing protein n=1 Tax=Domibacillus aminovorans TaxID=29332 RepID=A0A177L2F0_9BACI|nr:MULTISPECIES: LysR family transcriptional regulator substrate-binding protein [Bacillaceae]OAH59626.1 hypothetical protein AWH48_00535 [Domibacillus aminovorans]
MNNPFTASTQSGSRFFWFNLKNLNRFVILFSLKCRNLLDQTCISAQINLYPKIETSSIESLFELVKSGFGLTIVSKTLLDMYADRELSIIPIVQPCISREVSLVLRKDKFVGFGTRKFIELLTNEIIKLRFPITEKSKEQIRELTTI